MGDYCTCGRAACSICNPDDWRDHAEMEAAEADGEPVGLEDM